MKINKKIIIILLLFCINFKSFAQVQQSDYILYKDISSNSVYLFTVEQKNYNPWQMWLKDMNHTARIQNTIYYPPSERWRISLSKSGNLTPVVLDDSGNILYIGAEGNLYAIDNSGNILWINKVGRKIDGSPAIDSKGNVYIINELNEFKAYNPEGLNILTLKLKNKIKGNIVIDKNDVSHLITVYGTYLGINSSGEILWEKDITNNQKISNNKKIKYSGEINNRNIVYGGVVIDNNDKSYISTVHGLLSAFDNDDVLWQKEFGVNVFLPLAVNSKNDIIVPSVEDGIFSINSNSELNWNFNDKGSPDHNLNNKLVIYSPISIGINDEILFLSTRGQLYFINNDGKLLWKRELIELENRFYKLITYPVLDSANNSYLYLNTKKGTFFYKINSNGLTDWVIPIYNVREIIYYPVISLNGFIFFIDRSGVIIAMQ